MLFIIVTTQLATSEVDQHHLPARNKKRRTRKKEKIEGNLESRFTPSSEIFILFFVQTKNEK